MYRKSFFIVVLSLILMGLCASGAKMVMAIPGITGLPSSYDPKIAVEDAVKTSTKPLLIEFYTDTCRTCRVVTPWVYNLKEKYDDDLTFVMVDVSQAQNRGIAEIFGIEFIPAIFVFDFNHMAKSQVPVSSYGSAKQIDTAIEAALAEVRSDAKKSSSKN